MWLNLDILIVFALVDFFGYLFNSYIFFFRILIGLDILWLCDLVKIKIFFILEGEVSRV